MLRRVLICQRSWRQLPRALAGRCNASEITVGSRTQIKHRNSATGMDERGHGRYGLDDNTGMIAWEEGEGACRLSTVKDPIEQDQLVKDWGAWSSEVDGVLKVPFTAWSTPEDQAPQQNDRGAYGDLEEWLTEAAQTAAHLEAIDKSFLTAIRTSVYPGTWTTCGDNKFPYIPPTG
ncbi:hypothetical protein AAG570_011884 [Ranatra chinensis]|uniref:Uncharacterized protein n=1 Tax=Ranatra chinensis TaxID=642074 RepID=A0ABD0YVN2_9HEMI